MATPESIKKNIGIKEFYKALNYPDLETFISMNKDKVRKDRLGIAYVLEGVDYPEYTAVSETVETEAGDPSNFTSDPEIINVIQSKQQGTAGLTLAGPQPGVEKVSASEMIEQEDPSLTAADTRMKKQIEEMETLNLPDPTAEPPAEHLQGTETISLTKEQIEKGPAKKITDLPPDQAKRVLEGQPPVEIEEKPEPSEEEGERARQLAQGLVDDQGTSNRPITEQEKMNYSLKVQEVVDNFMDDGGYEFFNPSGELPYKVDIDAIDERIKKLDERLDQVSNEEIKPYFGKEDTGRKILAAIAAGIGAYASAMTGTPNYALQVLNKAIDDDLDKQKEELSFKRKSISDQRILLTEKRQELLTMAGMQINRAIARSQDERSKQKLKIMLTEVLLAKDTNEKRLMMDFVNVLQKRMVAQREGIVPGMGATPEQEGITNLKGEARTQAIKSSLNFMEMYHEAEITVNYLKNLMKPVEEGGEPRWKLLAPAELSETRTYLIGQIENLKLLGAKKLYEFGAALTPLEKQMLDQIVADAERSSIAFNVIEDRLDNFYNIMKQKRVALIKTYGFIPTNTGTSASQAPQSPQRHLPKSAQAGVAAP